MMWSHLFSSSFHRRILLADGAHVLPRTLTHTGSLISTSSLYLSHASTTSKHSVLSFVARTLAGRTRTVGPSIHPSNLNKRNPRVGIVTRNQDNDGNDFFADFGEWERENKNKEASPSKSSSYAGEGIGRGRRGEGGGTDRFRNNYRNDRDSSSNFQRYDNRNTNSNFSSSSRNNYNRERSSNNSFQRYDNRKGDFSPSSSYSSSRSSMRQDRPFSRQDRDRDTRRSSPRRFPSTGAGYVISDDDNQEGATSRPPRNQSFRENFTGTRVFVQNLPPDITWQELKDHFRVAGDVVFASVSSDPVTRAPKGCGIVQFETTDMAQNAINVMKDHPLRGISLFVREDVQERRSEDGYGSSGAGRNSRGSNSNTLSSWKCADEENSAFLSAEVRSKVESLISSRDQARRQRDYETSDEIRDELKSKYNVHVDDKMKAWWYSVDESVPKRISEMKGEGRWGDKALKPWRQIPTTPDSDACVNADLVDGLLNQRDIARKEKKYTLADSLLEQARTSPENNLTLRIHDESRTWRVWTDEAPPKEIYQKRIFRKNSNENALENVIPDSDGNSDESSPTKEVGKRNAADICLEILEKHDPSKIDEVKKLLAAFPGREGNILQRIKQNFNILDE